MFLFELKLSFAKNLFKKYYNEEEEEEKTVARISKFHALANSVASISAKEKCEQVDLRFYYEWNK